MARQLSEDVGNGLVDVSRVMLVWIARNYAINPAHVVLVFHGNDGHVEVSFVNGDSKSIVERELSDEGRALLLPPTVQYQRDS